MHFSCIYWNYLFIHRCLTFSGNTAQLYYTIAERHMKQFMEEITEQLIEKKKNNTQGLHLYLNPNQNQISHITKGLCAC